MKKVIIILIVFLIGSNAVAQQFVSIGTITYERTINMWADLPATHFEEFKKMIPQYKKDLFALTFTPQKSLYTPQGESKKFMIPIPAADNIVFTDFEAGKTVSSKNVFENNYLIEEALRNATWKIKDDLREIAGYTCRRATTVLFDSVFVVAFYTDQIIPPAGPESFNGLPGAILGLVINRLHTTWYATAVEIDGVEQKKIVPPVKGTKTSMADLIQKISQLIKNFGSQGDRLIWMIEV